MADGLQGVSVETVGIQLLPPQLGVQGLTVENIYKQYFYTQFGMVGIIVNETPDPARGVIKIIKKKSN
jgi:hypothetical protein